MAIFYFINWIVATETIEGGKLFKGGNYLRKYGTYNLIDCGHKKELLFVLEKGSWFNRSSHCAAGKVYWIDKNISDVPKSENFVYLTKKPASAGTV